MQIDWGNVKAVILDFGGVIFDIDYHRTINAYAALGYEKIHEDYSQLKQNGLFDQLEIGAISEAEFVEAIQVHLPNATHQAVLDAWNAILIGFPDGRLQTLEQIRERFPTYLLSNTNEIHVAGFHKMLEEHSGNATLEPLFDKVYFSHIIGHRKPDPESFEVILKEQGLRAEDVLFVDDSPQHIEAARALGLQGHWLTNGETLEELFAPFLA